MADELLSAVIRLENEIEDQLQQEQDRADAWLARVRTEQENTDRHNLQKLTDENGQIEAAAEQRANEAVVALESSEKNYCNELEQMSDQILLEILRRQLARLLPGQNDDHQDVQN